MILTNSEPHMISPKGLHRNANLDSLGGYGGENRLPFERARADFLTLYDQAQQLLSGSSSLAQAYPDGLPIYYKITPDFRPLTSPAESTAKFGGIPDLRWQLLPDTDEGNINTAVAKIWPRCGACHRPMRFVCQLSFGPLTGALHAMTCRSPGGDPEDTFSSLGYSKLHSAHSIDRWWSIFMCPDASRHFRNPNYDACVLIDWRFDNNGAKQNQTEADPWRDLVLQATEKYMAEIGELETNPGELQIRQQAMHGLHYGLDVRLSYAMDRSRQDCNQAVEELIANNPSLFGGDTNYRFFGKPRSQQIDRQPYCHASYLGPILMSPILNFTDKQNDVTYQIYGDVVVTDKFTIYCKVDASCT